MRLKCLSSGSQNGNCYLLESNSETLILDCGIPIKEIKKGLNFDISKVVGVCVTHGHQDHAKSVKDFERMGIPVFKPYESQEPMSFKSGSQFMVQAFDLTDLNGNFKHTNADGTECPCYGFLITHPEMGRMVYITDTELVKWRFKNINHVLISCDYQKKYMGEDNIGKKTHVLRGHMELETVKGFISANKSNALRNVILCHMSDSNSNPEECVKEIREVAGNGVSVDFARAGMDIELRESDCPF